MKAVLISILILASTWANAEETKEEWQGTILSDEVISKIQKGQFNYKKCVADAMRKPETSKLEIRKATDDIMKQCEPVLAEIRTVYTDAQVPGALADRHLKKIRIQVTRNLLQELMYTEAAKKAGQP
jgi:hypothetical protein